MNSAVWAPTVYNGDLIAGGDFSTAGGVSAKRTAKWNGTSWSPLGSGMETYVNALTVYNGELIAGGLFTTAGGVSANRIAKWNGTSWSPLGSGMNSAVYSLTVFDDGSGPALYAGGAFSTAGAVTTGRIAKWDGTSWSALGNELITGSPFALTAYNSALIVGGEGNFIAWEVSTHGIAKWDGMSWSSLGSGVGPLGTSRVDALTVFNAELIAGGTFTTAGGLLSPYWARWGVPASPAGGDLSVASIVLPAQAVIGEELPLSWTVTNGGSLLRACLKRVLYAQLRRRVMRFIIAR